MRLFHITNDLTHDGIFNPRIPLERMDTEDDSIPRICVCDSIEGCFSAMPYGGGRLDCYINSGLVFKVFEFEAQPEYTSEDLYYSELVLDAEMTGEHWITTKITPVQSYIIHLQDWKENCMTIYKPDFYKKWSAGKSPSLSVEEIRKNELLYPIIIDSIQYIFIEDLPQHTIDNIQYYKLPDYYDNIGVAYFEDSNLSWSLFKDWCEFNQILPARRN